VIASDVLSGLTAFEVTGTSNEPSDPRNPDIVISGSGLQPRVVQLRADKLGTGTGRIYTLPATAGDSAGNRVTATATCVVPHDQRGQPIIHDGVELRRAEVCCPKGGPGNPRQRGWKILRHDAIVYHRAWRGIFYSPR
jgi:hypothetical protein